MFQMLPEKTADIWRRRHLATSSFGGETSGSAAKCRVFPQAIADIKKIVLPKYVTPQ